MRWFTLLLIVSSLWFTLFLKTELETVVATPRPVVATTLASSTDPFESKFLDELNKTRSMHTLSPLSYHQTLHEIAEIRRDDMHELGYFAHKNPLTGRDFSSLLPAGSGYACENLLITEATDPVLVMQEWQASAAHDKCLMQTAPTHAAVSYREYMRTDDCVLYVYVYIASAL